MTTIRVTNQVEMDAAMERQKADWTIGIEVAGKATVTASEQATVTASEQATVRAAKFVTVLVMSAAVALTGGIRITLGTPEEWCDYTGAERDGEHVILFKALDPEWRSPHGTAYVPGTTVTAPDWDPSIECGGGLHFCAHVPELSEFFSDADHYVACRVTLAEMAAHEHPEYPSKIKARTCEVLYEVARDGKRLQPEEGVI